MPGLAWDRFSIVEHGLDAGAVIYVDSLTVYPAHPPQESWRRVFPQTEAGDVPLYVDHLMPGVADYSWGVNSDTEFDLPDGHRCIRATASPRFAPSHRTHIWTMAACPPSTWPTATQITHARAPCERFASPSLH